MGLLLFLSAANAAEFRVYKGKLYNVTAAEDWSRLEGYFHRTEANGIIADRVVYKERYSPPRVSRMERNGASFGARLPVQAYFVKEAQPGPPMLVRNFPKQPMAAGERFTCFAIEDGSTQIDGELFEVWDCGRPATAEEVEAELQRRAAETEKLRVQKQQQSDAVAAAKLPRVVAYQFQQASNGYPSFQVEIGKRYLKGDGVPLDLDLAKHWLRSACTNGSSEATNLLAKLP